MHKSSICGIWLKSNLRSSHLVGNIPLQDRGSFWSKSSVGININGIAMRLILPKIALFVSLLH